MMKYQTDYSLNKENYPLVVPITIKDHEQAQKFRSFHSQPQKRKEVYLNTLAVLAVNFHLKCLGIETNLAASDSWHPTMQTLGNIADLEVKDIGKLECRFVLPEAEFCEIPLEVCSDRIGYIAVQMNQALTEATIVGFVAKVTIAKLPLSQFKPLDELIDKLPPVVHLSDWIEDIFTASWHTIEELCQPQLNQLAFNFRSPGMLNKNLVKNSPDDIKRGKFLELENAGERIALLVGLESKAIPEMAIWVQISPTGENTYLPDNLQLCILDSKGEEVMKSQARSSKSIKFKFTAETGEIFSVQVNLGDAILTEEFLV
ncbi:MAG: DUF1822 family protein [Oscillatoria sp. PMC 1050.18]|nr:DUF1822 family protein [Oscillatoria sp. PMC 1050.18]